MSRLIDLTGRRFGKLTVIKRGPNKGKKVRWYCKCDCGNKTLSMSYSLLHGFTKSCFCSWRLPKGEANFNNHYYNYKREAKQRNLLWLLSRGEFRNIVTQDCHYCGAPPVLLNPTKNRWVNGGFLGNGIDRIDNSKGYTLNNTVPCCATCNKAKYTHTVDEFKEWAYRLYHHLFKEE